MVDYACARPLNPTLYNLLKQRFQSVQVANENSAMVGYNAPSLITRGRYDYVVASWGEYYRVRCPFCDDRRHRLWINHLYGQPNMHRNGYPESWLAVCYNEACTTNPANRHSLERMIFGFQNVRDRRAPMVIEIGEDHTLPLGIVQPPGEILPLSHGPRDHPARTYLIGRRFDPDWLAENFKVGFVFSVNTSIDERWRSMYQRIYMPVYMNGALVGWQGRLTWDPPKEGPPKYFTLPSMPKRRILYNVDIARYWPFVVVVEGLPSVWRIGGPAVAMFGKTLGQGQQLLLSTYWSGKPIILMLDPDARDEMEGILRELTTTTTSPIIPIWLSQGYDPADYTHEAVVSMIRSAAGAAGIDLPVW
jgi:hypothetical protein